MRPSETIADHVMSNFGMSEAEYFTDRANRGMSARQIAAEIGYSHVSVQLRLQRYADYMPGRWIPKRRAA